MTTPQAAEQFVDFRAAFEGAAVDAGRMSAKQFAGSVFALSELIERSAAVEFGQENAVVIEVRADFRRGSFDYGLVAAVVLPAAHHLLPMLTVVDLATLLRHIGILGGTAKSLLGLVKRIGPKPVEIRQEGDNNVAVVFVAGDHSEIISGVEPAVARLLQSERVRSALPDVVKPLLVDGIDRLRIGTRDEPRRFVVSREEVAQFEPPTAREDELTDSIAETALELLSPHFVQGHVWNVAQGGQVFNVRVLDTGFIKEVDDGRRFAKGDYLIVELRTRTFATTKGMRVEREVIRVLDHKERSEQPTLF
jgi:hypothetical protein